MTILVTGGAGFIGSHLVDFLVAQGEVVTVLDDLSVGFRSNLAEAEVSGKVRFVEGSVMDQAAVATAMEGCDRVFHLAVQCVRRSLGNPLESHDVNATGTIRVLEEARRRSVKRLVYCSTSEVYGNSSDGRLNEDETLCKPVTVYGAAKLAGELYASAYFQNYQLPTVVVRPFNAYGPRAYQTGTRAEVLPRFVGRVLNGQSPIIFGDGNNARDFTYVAEVARGIAAAGSADGLVGGTVNIAFGQAVTVRNMAELVLKALGRSDLTAQYLPGRPGDVHHLHADTSKAQRVLGFKAAVSLNDGISRYIEWLREQYPDPTMLVDPVINNWSQALPLERSEG